MKHDWWCLDGKGLAWSAGNSALVLAAVGLSAITDSCGHIIICVLISPDCSKIWPTERGGAPFLDWRGDRNVYWREFPERLEGWGHPLRVSSVCSCITDVVGPLDLCNGDKSKFHVTLSMFSNWFNAVRHILPNQGYAYCNTHIFVVHRPVMHLSVSLTCAADAAGHWVYDQCSFYWRFHDVPAQKLRDMQKYRRDVGTVLKTGEFVEKKKKKKLSLQSRHHQILFIWPNLCPQTRTLTLGHFDLFMQTKSKRKRLHTWML